MKRLIYLCLILLVVHMPFVANAQDNDKPDLPAEAELSAIVDSILDEGLRLYSFERISWQASDSAMAHCTALAQVNGSGIVVDSVSFTHFFTRDDEVVFSYKSDLSNENVSWDNTVRPITDAERNARDERKRCIRLAIESYGDSLRASGNVNVDVIWVSPDLIRVYFLQSTTKNDVVPIGNDYSVDISPDMKPLAFRRYHHSFLEIPSVADGNVVQAHVHSHTPDNPYITPTDICNMMLYGRDLYGLNTYYVLSTAFKKDVIQIFNAANLNMTIMEYDEFKSLMDKINNHN